MKDNANAAAQTTWRLPRKTLSVACMTMALAPASTLFAADVLEEIVVTAQFKEQNLQETPIAITAVSGEMLEARNQTSLATVAAQAPNVVLYETGGYNSPGLSATIRGIGQNDFTPALEPGVGLYIDDVYYPSLTGANFNLLDLERLEIARGPQGTLAGRNSLGGAVKLYSVKPKGDNTGSARVTWGSRNLMEVRAVGDFPIVKDALFARISGVSHKQNGYVTRLDYGCANPGSGSPINTQQGDCVLGTEGGKDYTAGRLALRWLASDSVEVNLSLDNTQDNSEVGATTPLATGGAGTAADVAEQNGHLDPNFPWANGGQYGSQYVPSNPYVSYASFCSYRPATQQSFCYAPVTKTNSWGTNLTVDWKPNSSMSIKSITAYREYDSRWVEDNDTTPASVTLGAEHSANHSFSQELRLSGALNDAFDYTVGLYYFDQVTQYKNHQNLNFVVFAPVPFVAYEFLSFDTIKASSYAGYANGSWHLSNAWTVDTGVRYTHEKKDYLFGRTNVDGTLNPFNADLNGFQSPTAQASRTDYRLNTNYKWTDSVMTYASVSTGFKGGGTNPRPFVSQQVIPFKPEQLTAYEVGAKMDWLDNTLRTNVAVFKNKYKDIQILLTNCPETSPATGFPPGFPCARPANAGDAEIKGVELEVNYRPISGLAIDGSYSHLSFKYTKLDPNTFDPVTGQPPGPNGPGQVKSKYSIGVQYDTHLGDNTITPRLDYSFQGGYNSPINPINTPENYVGGYHLLNGQITLKPASETWQVTIAGKNLTNKVYYTNIFENLQQGSWKYGMIAPPREYQVQLQKKF